MISRDEALQLVKKHIKTENTVKHMIATEAIMKALAKKFSAKGGQGPINEKVWAMAGLLHDMAYEAAKPIEKHASLASKMLKENNIDVPEEVHQAIKAHAHDVDDECEAPKNKMDWSLFICDSLTGLIVATALVRPDRKLSSVKVKSVMKKFKNKAFAAGTRREEIAMCEEKLGIELRDFVELSLEAMQQVSDELGL